MTELFRLDWQTRDFDACIFDCDGTLVDSMPLHFRAWRQAFSSHGARFDFDWALFTSRAGVGLEETVQELNEQFAELLDPAAVVRDQLANYEALIHQLTVVEPVLAFLDSVTTGGTRRVPVAVASGGTRPHVEASLAAVALDKRFECVLTREDVTHGKPHPEMFLLAAQRLGVAPERCVVFEDGLPGVEAARRANMGWVFVERVVPDGF
jgi:beta-phosphoglucomutase-like phosphatase (HAD superfamily)